MRLEAAQAFGKFPPSNVTFAAARTPRVDPQADPLRRRAPRRRRRSQCDQGAARGPCSCSQNARTSKPFALSHVVATLRSWHADAKKRSILAGAISGLAQDEKRLLQGQIDIETGISTAKGYLDAGLVDHAMQWLVSPTLTKLDRAAQSKKGDPDVQREIEGFAAKRTALVLRVLQDLDTDFAKLEGPRREQVGAMLRTCELGLHAVTDEHPAAVFALGLAQADKKAHDKAAASFQRIVGSSAAGLPDALRSEARLALASELISAGKATTAAKALAGRSDVASLELMGRAQLAAGKYGEAATAFRGVLGKKDGSLSPRIEAQCRLGLIDALLKQQKLEGVAKLLATPVPADPRLRDRHSLLKSEFERLQRSKKPGNAKTATPGKGS